MAQKLKGQIRGIKGLQFTPYTVNAGVYSLDTANLFAIKYTQNATQEYDLQEGEKASLSGSGVNVINIKDPDQILGVNVTFSSSRIDIETASKIIGGKLEYTTAGDNLTPIRTWNPPTDPNGIPGLFLEIFVQNYESDNNPSGFIVLTLPFVKCGYPKLPEQTEKDFLRFDYTAYGTRSPMYVDEATTPLVMPGPLFYDFVDALPAALA